MCGIFAIFKSKLSENALRKKLIKSSLLLRHRGPDWSGYFVDRGTGIAHERLAIIDPESGSQPLHSVDGNLIVAANGEIYNFREILAGSCASYAPLTASDCEVVIPLFQQGSIEGVVSALRGMFAFVIYDLSSGDYHVIRDHVGIIPLYIGYSADGSIMVSSEMKALIEECPQLQQFPPGHYLCGRTGQMVCWYNPLWAELSPGRAFSDPSALRCALERAAESHMMSDVPWGVLLSGGLDSSLVAAIAARAMRRVQTPQAQEGGTAAAAMGHAAWFPRLHSFCVGLKDSPDSVAAAKVAAYLGTVHHSYTYTIQEGLDALSQVIYHLETYDVTTIRAATPMFLMSRKIKAMGIKMVLSGEGADEIFAGYLYFHRAPSPAELHAELCDKLARLHVHDCLRANKATSAWGVEARVPFLDAAFLDYAMGLDPALKMVDAAAGRIEKYVLRKAFDCPEDPYLPADVLWRQKEQFSDGVGYGWIDALRAHVDQHVTDAEFSCAAQRFPIHPPLTKEAYYYRSLFASHFPGEAAARTVPGGASIACSTERALAWDKSFQNRADCSGRAVAGVHADAYGGEFSLL